MHGDVIQTEIIAHPFAGHHPQAEVRVGDTRTTGPRLCHRLPACIEGGKGHLRAYGSTIDPPLQARGCGVADGARAVAHRVGLPGAYRHVLAVHVPQGRGPARIHDHEIAAARAEELPVVTVRIGTDPVVAIAGERGAGGEARTESGVARAEVAVRKELSAGVDGLAPIGARRANSDRRVRGTGTPEIAGETRWRRKRHELALTDGGIVADGDGARLGAQHRSQQQAEAQQIWA